MAANHAHQHFDNERPEKSQGVTERRSGLLTNVSIRNILPELLPDIGTRIIGY